MVGMEILNQCVIHVYNDDLVTRNISTFLHNFLDNGYNLYSQIVQESRLKLGQLIE